jgi:outer membrane receptor protein involved in Fe transport
VQIYKGIFFTIQIWIFCIGFAAAETNQRQSLQKALENLRSQGMKIFYSSDLVKPDMFIANEPKEKDLKEKLQAYLAAFGLKADQGPGEIWLVVKDGVKSAKEPSGISGAVYDESTKKPLAAAKICISQRKIEALTSKNGRFEISVEPGTYTLETHLPGFAVKQMNSIVVFADRKTVVVIELTSIPVQLEELVVTPGQFTLLENQPAPREFLTRQDIVQLPHLSDDVFRAIGRLPGTSGGDFSAAFNVRGGELDEIQVVVDGLELYEPFHLKDFQNLFSMIDSEAIDGIDFLTGSFPAEYGGRMSGVLDMTSATPSEELRTSFSVSLINARVMSEGSFRSNRGQWLASARRGYLDFVLPLVDADASISPIYYDVFGKVQYQLGDMNLISGNFLGLFDRVHSIGDETNERVRADYKNLYSWVNLKTAWSDRLNSESIFSTGWISKEREGGFVENFSSALVRDDRNSFFLGVKQDWTFELNRKNFWKWGINLKYLSAHYEYSSISRISDGRFSPATTTTKNASLRPNGNEYGAYFADRILLFDPLAIEFGIRWDRQDYIPDDQFSPRLNAVYHLGEQTAIRLGWGRIYQPQRITEIQVEDGINQFFPAQQSEHRLVGIEHSFWNDFHLRVEGYQKIFKSVQPRFENLFDPIELFPEAEIDRVQISPDRSEAKGIEMILRKEGGDKLSWWVGYVLSYADDRIDGDWIPRSWDQRHALTFSVNYRLGEKWNINFAGLYHSGWPTTNVTADSIQLPNGSIIIQPVVGERNADRFPSFQRFDVRVGRTWQLRRSDLQLFMEVTNLLDRKNVCCVDGFDFFLQTDGTVLVEEELDYWLPRIPSFGLLWEF